MFSKFVSNELELPGVDGSVLWIVLGQKDDRLVSFASNSQFEKYVWIVAGDIGYEKGGDLR
jgi:hypothetical protein